MKILLVAVNAKYIHSNPAVYSLRTYSGKYKELISIAEFTINNSIEEILAEIYMEQADIVAFSCYIWNIGMITRLIAELKLVQPGVVIWCGGPEVSFHSAEYLEKQESIDGIVIGEGERSFLELMGYYLDQSKELEDIGGLVFRESARLKEKITDPNIANRTVKEKTVEEPASKLSELAEKVEDEKHEKPIVKTIDKTRVITQTSFREPMSLDELPFPYDDMELFRNKIIYYESSRGCPYTCSYCLSSVDKRVRLRSTELVKKELQLFLDHQVAQVKFVDRTFNCNRSHTAEIWRYIREQDNGITNFHFEITADLLSEEELTLLSTLRPGQVQLEIGVQTTNSSTMEAIRRKVDYGKLANNVERIRKGHNIHLHLDLIAGLPLEDLSSFRNSFNDVYRLHPDQLQLGFLKVLKGSLMEEECERYGIIYREDPPYEVLYTAALPYRDLLLLKGVCEMVEVYYNSGQFATAIRYLEHFFETPFELYRILYEYYKGTGLDRLAHSRVKRYEILVDFYRDLVIESDICSRKEGQSVFDPELFHEILLYDMYLREDLKSRPYFARASLENRLQNELREANQLTRTQTHLEYFTYDVAASAETGIPVKQDHVAVFRYDRRDPISYSAEVTVLKEIPQQ
jgi:radical SAM superfamily enzyme YgiQ (UPF0313 family)